MPTYSFQLSARVAGSSVSVTAAGSSTVVASGTLDANAQFTASLPAGDYVATAAGGHYQYRSAGTVAPSDPDGLADLGSALAKFRTQPSGATNPPGEDVLIGTTAWIHPSAGTAGVLGGGHTGYENVIGGDTATVATTTTNIPAVNPAFAVAPSWSYIVGGYDNVVNGWACQVQGYHCKIEQNASHGTIGGGSAHAISADVDYATIAGGTQNSVQADQGTIGGGSSHIVSGVQGTVGGGLSNDATATLATIGGGQNNTASGNYSSIVGGSGNTAGPGANATVSGGSGGTASGIAALVSGGTNGQATGDYSTVAGGMTNTATAIGAAALGGRESTAAGAYSVTTGRDALASYDGVRAHASGKFAAQGDAQHLDAVMRNQTTDATAKTLFLQGSAIYLTVPVSSTWAFDVLVVARANATSESAAYRLTGCIERGASGAASMVGTPIITVLGEDVPAWDCLVSAGANGALIVQGVGEVGKTIRWVGTARIASVSG